LSSGFLVNAEVLADWKNKIMKTYEPMRVLPAEFQREWLARLNSAPSPEFLAGGGVYRLVAIRRTNPAGFEGQRLIVLVVDENGFPLPNVPVAFAYSTARHYLVDEQFKWIPPQPFQADVVATGGGGQIEHIQGGAVKAGQPGGVTVYLLDPDYGSDSVSGMGMLADHTGVHLTFQLRRNGVKPLEQRLAAIEAKLAALEGDS